jgi:hypothetical protein
VPPAAQKAVPAAASKPTPAENTTPAPEAAPTPQEPVQPAEPTLLVDDTTPPDGAALAGETEGDDFCPDAGVCFPGGLPANVHTASCIHGDWYFGE